MEPSKIQNKSPDKQITPSANTSMIADNSAMSDYTQEKIAGNGTFGVVYAATRKSTRERVAIKKVFQDPRYKNRELELMQCLSHTNIVRLVHHFYTEGPKPNEIFLNLIMEYVPETLHRYTRNLSKTHGGVPPLLAKLYAYQIIRGIGFCHLHGICHRDIKPQNLLIDPQTHRVVLCDFGSAKRLVQGEPNIAYICSRYYRAPELVLGASAYNTAIDVWSAGCVIAEVYLGRPLFPGETAADQIVQIMRVIGSPTREQIQDMNPRYNGVKLPEIKANTLSRTLKGKAPADAIHFIDSLLNYSPNRRPNAYQALRHSFFDELRRPDLRLPDGSALPSLEDWKDEELKFMQRF